MRIWPQPSLARDTDPTAPDVAGLRRARVLAVALTVALAVALVNCVGEGAGAGGGGLGAAGDGGPVDGGPVDGSPVGSDADAVGAGGVDGAASDGGADNAAVFAVEVVAFAPGAGAGFGADKLPGVVLGPPKGGGPSAGSLDVVSLGKGGEIVVAFGVDVVDGEGADFIVFENAFSTWRETAAVSVSADGQSWHDFPCDPLDKAGGYPGCAGTHAVLSAPDNGVDPRDPAVAGGDPFDLAALPSHSALAAASSDGVAKVRYVRIRDSGQNDYAGTTGGFDLDAVAAVHVAASP